MASKSQDAIALLKADHRKVEDLFSKFEKARDSERQQALAKQICTELIVHSTLEEEIFYPASKGKVDDDLLHESYVEHDGAKVLVSELMESSPEDEFYEAKMSVLSEEIKHHVKEEEKPGEGVFAQMRASGLDLLGLGERLQERKKELLDTIERQGLPTPITRSFKGPKLERGEVVGRTT
jgi:hypothetical protein